MLGALRYLISAALVAFILVGVASAVEAKPTFYLIRHAEKQDDGTRDPSLTEQGRARAEWLAEYFTDKGVTAIYSSEFKRTLETVAPLSERLGMPIAPYNPRALEDLAVRLRDDAEREDCVIVISGHSNTTPAMINILIGEDRFPDLVEAWMYDRIFKVVFGEDGEASVEISYSEPRRTAPTE